MDRLLIGLFSVYSCTADHDASREIGSLLDRGQAGQGPCAELEMNGVKNMGNLL